MAKETADFTQMSIEERINLIEQIYVGYPRSTEILSKIGHCHTYSLMSAEPECLLIKGDTGTGKTTLYHRYERKYQRTVTKERTSVPVLATTIPIPATPKNLVTKLLVKIDDPLATRGSINKQTLRLCTLLKQCETQLIILDEFQHFIDRDSNKVLQTVSDWLKELLNETRIPIILIGMPNCEAILESNKQLRRRFAMRVTLEPFGWNHDNPEVQKRIQDEFRHFLRLFDKQIPLKERAQLSDPLTAYRIHCATRGNVASVVKLLRRAAVLALLEGEEKITLEILGKAYAERLADEQPKFNNPFRP